VNKIKIAFYLGMLLVISAACTMPGWPSNKVTPLPLAGDTPEATQLPTETPLPTATSTPQPYARVELGDWAIFLGDWDNALGEYQQALDSSQDAEVQFAARLGIARTHFLAGDLTTSQEQLEALISENVDFPHLAEAYFVLAQVHEAQGNFVAAAEHYEKYIELGPGVIDSHVNELRGDALTAAGDYLGAIAAYQAALAAPRLNSSLDIEFKMAQAYDYSGDLATALIAYQDIYSRSANDYLRARLDYLIAQAYLALGEEDLAQEAYLDAVTNYPLSYDSYLALVDLVDAGVEVDELQRGLIDYYAGQYAVAVAAFDRYIQADLGDIATAKYYKGLSQNALGDHEGALETWDEIIQSHPDAEVWDDAWEQTAEVLWFHLGEYQESTEVLLDFVDQFPTQARAAEFLFHAAMIAERGEELDQAATLWSRVASEYPGSDLAEQAFHSAGITRYRLADYLATEEIFQKQLAFSMDLDARSAAYFWIGKARKAMGEEESALTAWEQAAQVDPTGYYSERANDLLAGIEPFTPPLEYDLAIDVKAEKQAAEEWMRTIFAIPDEVDLSSLGSLAADARFERGKEFWRLGMYEAARNEFEDLRLSLVEDPANSYRLANYLLEKGLYRTAIFAARQVLDQAGMDDAETMSAPRYFNHIRFGPYYRELVMPASETYNFHPLFLFSVMRQESLFEGFVRSDAGARGLMQIIPSTGQEVAANAGWPPGYTDEDLYRPLVSVNLGSDYLNRQRGYMSGDLYGALAAYNGGPGNAMTWKNLVPPDPDLYVEVIRFPETKEYIKGISEIFSIYKQLYDRTP
jgi:soluble lytic murein transglycosylase